MFEASCIRRTFLDGIDVEITYIIKVDYQFCIGTLLLLWMLLCTCYQHAHALFRVSSCALKHFPKRNLLQMAHAKSILSH